jgi:hypothetical protein
MSGRLEDSRVKTQRVVLTALGTGVMILSLLVAPADCVAEDSGRADPLREGAWAVQFGITPNFTLNTFSGGILSMKRHFSSHSAVRGGLSGSLQSLDEKDGWSLSDTAASADNAWDTRSLGIELQYLYYPRPTSEAALYFGTGPSFQSSKDDQEYRADERRNGRTRHEWTLGLVNSLGVEWCPAKFIGIHAEYGLEVVYVSRSESSTSPTDSGPYLRESDSHGWRVANRPVRFGVSVYF